MDFNEQEFAVEVLSGLFTRPYVLSLNTQTIARGISVVESMLIEAMNIDDNFDQLDVMEQIEFQYIKHDMQRMRYNLNMLTKALSHKEKFALFYVDNRTTFVHFN